MPIRTREQTISGGGTRIIVAQQGRTEDYAKPTDAASALADPVAFTNATNILPQTIIDRYIKKIYRVSNLSYKGNIALLENPSIGSSVDRQKGQAGAKDTSGDMTIINVVEGLEVWLQTLTGDRSPTVAAIASTQSLRYTFTPSNTPLPGLTAEVLRGVIPERHIGIQANQLSFSMARNDLSSFVFSLLGLNFQENTAATTDAAGTPIPAADGTTKVRTIPTVAPADLSAATFEEILNLGFPGWSSRIIDDSDTAILGSAASFTYNNNFAISGDLIGTQGASRVVRPEGSFREISAEVTIPYTRDSLTSVYDFIESSDGGQITLEFRLLAPDGQTRRLAFIIGNFTFEELPSPDITSGGEVGNPITMRILPSDPGANDIVSIEYDVPIAKATQLQTYAA